MQCFMKTDDKSLIDVENVVTAGERNVLPSELTNTIDQFIVYVHRNFAHTTSGLYWTVRPWLNT